MQDNYQTYLSSSLTQVDFNADTSFVYELANVNKDVSFLNVNLYQSNYFNSISLKTLISFNNETSFSLGKGSKLNIEYILNYDSSLGLPVKIIYPCLDEESFYLDETNLDSSGNGYYLYRSFTSSRKIRANVTLNIIINFVLFLDNKNIYFNNSGLVNKNNRICYQNENGSYYYLDINYDSNNKIISIENNLTNKETIYFTYTNGLISLIETKKIINNSLITIERISLNYLNNVLSSITKFLHNKVNYVSKLEISKSTNTLSVRDVITNIVYSVTYYNNSPRYIFSLNKSYIITYVSNYKTNVSLNGITSSYYFSNNKLAYLTCLEKIAFYQFDMESKLQSSQEAIYLNREYNGPYVTNSSCSLSTRTTMEEIVDSSCLLGSSVKKFTTLGSDIIAIKYSINGSKFNNKTIIAAIKVNQIATTASINAYLIYEKANVVINSIISNKITIYKMDNEYQLIALTAKPISNYDKVTLVVSIINEEESNTIIQLNSYAKENKGNNIYKYNDSTNELVRYLTNNQYETIYIDDKRNPRFSKYVVNSYGNNNELLVSSNSQTKKTYIYDSNYNVIKLENSNYNHESFNRTMNYSGDEYLIKLKDEDNKETTFAYDSYSRLCLLAYQIRNKEEYGYTTNDDNNYGKPYSLIKKNSTTELYKRNNIYNAKGNIYSIDCYENNSLRTRIFFDYDSYLRNNKVSITSTSNIIYQCSYNVDDNLISENIINDTLNYTYNANKDIISILFNNILKYSFTYSNDERKLLTNISLIDAAINKIYDYNSYSSLNGVFYLENSNYLFKTYRNSKAIVDNFNNNYYLKFENNENNYYLTPIKLEYYLINQKEEKTGNLYFTFLNDRKNASGIDITTSLLSISNGSYNIVNLNDYIYLKDGLNFINNNYQEIKYTIDSNKKITIIVPCILSSVNDTIIVLKNSLALYGHSKFLAYLSSQNQMTFKLYNDNYEISNTITFSNSLINAFHCYVFDFEMSGENSFSYSIRVSIDETISRTISRSNVANLFDELYLFSSNDSSLLGGLILVNGGTIEESSKKEYIAKIYEAYNNKNNNAIKVLNYYKSDYDFSLVSLDATLLDKNLNNPYLFIEASDTYEFIDNFYYYNDLHQYVYQIKNQNLIYDFNCFEEGLIAFLYKQIKSTPSTIIQIYDTSLKINIRFEYVPTSSKVNVYSFSSLLQSFTADFISFSDIEICFALGDTNTFYSFDFYINGILKVNFSVPITNLINNLKFSFGSKYNEQLVNSSTRAYLALITFYSYYIIDKTKIHSFYQSQSFNKIKYDSFNRIKENIIEDGISKIEYLYNGNYALPSSMNFYDNNLLTKTTSLTYNDYRQVTNGDNKNYAYNNKNELTSADDGEACYMYNYDILGNIISKTINKRGISTTINYSYLDSNNPYLLTKYNNYDFNYQNNYLISIALNGIVKKAFTYQGRNLTQLIDYNKSNKICYYYDENDIRIKKCIYQINENSETLIQTNYYFYNNNLLIYEKEIRNSIIYYKYYLYDANGKIYGFIINNSKYYFKKDAFGCIIKIVDSNNDFICNYYYEPYGKVSALDIDGNIITNPLSVAYLNSVIYKDYLYDNDTSLYYLTSRYYDPEIGRFISPDIVDCLDNTNINGLNLYAYCNNDPINLCDPLGHFAISSLIGLAISIGIEAAVGAFSYVTSEGISYIITGEWSWSWAQFTGNVLGGALGGACSYILSLGTMTGAFITSALSTGIGMHLQNQWEDTDYSFGQMIFTSVINGLISASASGFFEEIPIQGLNKGKGCYKSIAKQINTKFNVGSIKHITCNTFSKMMTYSMIESLIGTSYSGAMDAFNGNDWLSDLWERKKVSFL